jgi:hypothetical protein
MLNQTDAIIAHDALKAVAAEEIRQDLYSTYSDLFKDENGIRPRWAFDWSIADLMEALDRLCGVEAPEPAMPTSGEGWSFTPAEVL